MTSCAEYQTAEKALAYLALADSIPNRTHGERMVLDLLPVGAKRILDLGTGDGRLLAQALLDHPNAEGVAADFSLTMLERARERFNDNPLVNVLELDFREPLPPLGQFNAIISSFAIHHVEDPRKRALYEEIFLLLEPGGVFVNLEHVASPTEELHDAFLEAMGQSRETEDKSNRCTAAATQLVWLEEIGFENVDCFWKWRELAVLAGAKQR